MSKVSRREIGKGALAASIGLALPSCRSSTKKKEEPQPALANFDLRTGLAVLVATIVPWSADDPMHADFMERFLRPDALENFVDRKAVVESTVESFTTLGYGLQTEKIDFAALGEEEGKLVHDLVSQIYSIVEVRSSMAGEAAPGNCLGSLVFLSQSP